MPRSQEFNTFTTHESAKKYGCFICHIPFHADMAPRDTGYPVGGRYGYLCAYCGIFTYYDLVEKEDA